MKNFIWCILISVLVTVTACSREEQRSYYEMTARGQELYVVCANGTDCHLENVSKNPARPIRIREVYAGAYGEFSRNMYTLQPGEKHKIIGPNTNVFYVYTMEGGLIDFIEMPSH